MRAFIEFHEWNGVARLAWVILFGFGFLAVWLARRAGSAMTTKVRRRLGRMPPLRPGSGSLLELERLRRLGAI